MDQDAKSVWNSANVKLSEHHLAPLPEEYSQHWPGIQALSSVTQFSSDPSVEGSSSGSDRSCERPFDLNCGYIPVHGSMNRSIGKFPGSKKPEYNVSSLKTKLALNCGNVVEKEKKIVIQEPKTKKFRSKNLVTERKRRHRIKDGLFTLRALVPKITKVKIINTCEII